eukprot:TRINITY_DN2246_c0_g1_i1.p1 TRINITY_DN2246_c0_g1~~TRINITY_DN2246_c0_g1_i1.p1  ORF type:complete len:617 (+),score=136.01 TRINITY_DN2246_c0_g1_i1:18-1868(+)
MTTIRNGSGLGSSLPFLPGCTFTDPRKTSFPKGHVFDVKNGTKSVSDPPSEEELRQRALAQSNTSAALYPKPAPGEEYVPSWAAFDKQVLRFEAFFKEPVVESQKESYRVRKVALNFFLEDDTMSVTEPKIQNSGLGQGTMVRRHRIPKESDNTLFYTVADLNVGIDITIYAKTFHVTKCDSFTRDFLGRLGRDVGLDEESPEDPFTQKNMSDSAATYRRVREEEQANKTMSLAGTTLPLSSIATSKRENRFPLRQFIQNDRKVLRFYCIWDDKSSSFGDLRKFTLHYFLADDTIEVLEVIPPNSGRDPFPTMMKRQPLQPSFPGIRELKIGNTIEIFSRKFLIYDVDKFTQSFFKDNYGVTDFTPLRVDEDRVPLPARPIPDYTGFGSEEDSLTSVASLEQHPPKKDWLKKRENEGKVLRFEAKFEDPAPEDEDRRFAVSYWLVDDTISILELPDKRGTIKGGRFFEKARVRRAGVSLDQSTSVEEHYKKVQDSYYAPPDFFVGSLIVVNAFKFRLLNAAEWTFKYMEAFPSTWPESDFALVVDTISGSTTKDLGAALQSESGGEDTVSAITMESVLLDCGVSLTPQQLCTIRRALDIDNNGKLHFDFLLKHLGQ